jgi:(4-(4-[2-(gamma-L-glutamylamino)ethyl]phenoxymethyl)furan-2-yl)methanamine synthase
LGFDIGGANTKAASVKTKNGEVIDIKTGLTYFPFWKRDKTQLDKMLLNLKNSLCESTIPDAISITMTAELSDVFSTKRDGVNYILESVYEISGKIPILVLNVDGNLCSMKSALADPLKVAAANWAATGWMVSQIITDCVVVDVGSTSTSIIPIVESKVVAEGKTDLEKLINGELVYTGSLRTNVAATVELIPVKGELSRVSSELFAQSADVHLLLGNIKSEDYVADTPDGKGKSRQEALTRLAKVVCADTEILNEQQIIQMAEFVFQRQVDQIANAVTQVYSRLKPDSKECIPMVVTGLGRSFLARKAAEKANVISIKNLEEILPASTALATPAVGVALMAATQLEGKRLKWQ